MYAVIRLRGDVGLRPEIRDTLKMLRLHRVNHCVLLPDDPHYLGMIKKVTNHVAWGEVNLESVELLLRRRGRLEGGKRLTDEYLRENTEFDSIESLSRAIYEGKVRIKDIPKLKPVFRLHPPRKGHRGIKRSFKEGGELGYHGDKINDLIKKMR
ncbi:MAG TPA: 50S ribosomal protein L30 [Candidatus Syntrophoarchaeum butanivorans]|uniref:Large ribosomal subunit protein uL30 n=1 Tax=Candidatus Syntropharchaeum butanivorans TaxID=1839936 RepID=A0A1F2P5B1_9EURY|nr:MAG: Ribosomal protein L30, archaeal [Candidatus Syntrophoarchaeum butanivorans]HDM36776.1 50S ribosomal protein L30 [Candidatus Syntrophoarchaeum butanivorans]HEC56319.1 50S ribosomal protein L30 [Candidatus Syntrophoarchaeum butanivorans]